jgi:hypothetical protein
MTHPNTARGRIFFAVTHFSQAALNALERTRKQFSIQPGLHSLDEVLSKLETERTPSVSQILLRRELRRMSQEEREATARALQR